MKNCIRAMDLTHILKNLYVEENFQSETKFKEGQEDLFIGL